jgi:hypothetical protein
MVFTVGRELSLFFPTRYWLSVVWRNLVLGNLLSSALYCRSLADEASMCGSEKERYGKLRNSLKGRSCLSWFWS